MVTSKKRKSLLDLEGKISFARGYDYKALRTETAFTPPSDGEKPKPRKAAPKDRRR